MNIGAPSNNISTCNNNNNNNLSSGFTLMVPVNFGLSYFLHVSTWKIYIHVYFLSKGLQTLFPFILNLQIAPLGKRIFQHKITMKSFCIKGLPGLEYMHLKKIFMLSNFAPLQYMENICKDRRGDENEKNPRFVGQLNISIPQVWCIS